MNVELPDEPSLLDGEDVVAAAAVVLPDELELEPALCVALLVPEADTLWPTSPDSETIVPSSGALSFVFSTACSSLLTVSVSLLTAARAEARLASRVASLCLDSDTPPLADDSSSALFGVEPDELGDEPFAGEVVVFVFVVGVVVVAGAVAGSVVVPVGADAVSLVLGEPGVALVEAS